MHDTGQTTPLQAYQSGVLWARTCVWDWGQFTMEPVWLDAPWTL